MSLFIGKFSKGILAIIMTIALFTGAAYAVALQDGQYTIGVEALNSTTGAPSMANDAIKKPAKLEVEAGKIYVLLEMADSMYDLAAEDGAGGFQPAAELSENREAKTFTYKFPVDSIEEPVLMEAVVAAMGRKVNFKLAFDNATLVKTGAVAEPASQPAAVVSQTNVNVPNPQTGDDSFTSVYNLILTGLGLSAATYFIYKIK